jgi:hypothetical protein
MTARSLQCLSEIWTVSGFKTERTEHHNVLSNANPYPRPQMHPFNASLIREEDDSKFDQKQINLPPPEHANLPLPLSLKSENKNAFLGH